MRRSIVYLVLLALAFIIAASMITGFRDDSLELQQKQYCELVRLHQQDDSLGWPDYKNRFDKDCNPDGSVKVQP